VLATIGGETIAAIATAIVPQAGSVGIVRLSGSEAMTIARTIFAAPGKQVWESHRILYGLIRHPETQQVIDEALLLIMLAPRSYTREDVVEFHCHGGIVAVQQVLQLCIASGARLAQPGEFTLRAFLNGRIDLTQAEGIRDLVGALSPAAAVAALAGIQGKLSKPIRELYRQTIDLLAEVEARIDFGDDLPPLDEEAIKAELVEIEERLATIAATADRGELLRTGIKVAILGQPNVGKSSLLNAWSRSDRAIVADLPGTTRDVVESQLVVDGVPITVLDTAGIRETSDTVEKIGVARSRSAARQADLILLVIDATIGWTDLEEGIIAEFTGKFVIIVANKCDLVAEDANFHIPEKYLNSVVKTAAARDMGIDRLEAQISHSFSVDTAALPKANRLQAANLDLAIDARQAAAITTATVALGRVRETIAAELPYDFWTIDLRAAVSALAEVTGEELNESVLDRIFSRFCIGK
jgi:tRNA modification GTPase